MTSTSRRQKKGISTVLTTLIIVVASVVLGTAVTLFGTSLFTGVSQQQAISTSSVKVWYNGTTTDTSVGAVVIRNTGDKIVAVDSISVRGTTIPFSNWYYNSTGATTTNIQKALSLSNTTPTNNCCLQPPGKSTAWDLDKDGNTDLAGAGSCTAAAVNCALQQGTGPISLTPGKAVIIYFGIPLNTLTGADVGGSITVGVGAGQVHQVQTVTIAKV